MSEIADKLTIHLKRNTMEKWNIEEAILGAVLIESTCLSQIVDVLEPKNFSNWHRDVWVAILHHYQQSLPIDLRTIYRTITNQDITALMIAGLISKVNSTAHIQRHAITLLELNMLQHFIEMYLPHSKDPKVAAFAEDIFQSLAEENDTLKVMDDAVQWMTHVLPQSPFTKELIRFNEAIQLRANKIQRRDRIRQCISQLESLAAGPNKQEIKEITDLLILTINCQEVPVAFTKELYKLKKHLTDK